MNLYKLHTSPFNHTNLSSLIQLLTSEDGLLLTQDAVYVLRNPGILQELSSVNAELYILKEDMLARGLVNNSAAKPIDYSQMVELCLRFDNVISW